MKTELVRWGNSLALRVPKPVVEELGAKEGSAMEMTVRDGELLIRLARPKRKRKYTIEELVAGITPENRHEELDWGPDVGAEILPPYKE
ncbi:MAG TPA: AbrB/MazE/SpoVT family DNA-binding domain-containing protein [Xanthobacteraceae bacterium]|jgi:antitoxin MazE|nr:AbrB/MazE/SpoVT family DNA-binding domain-containing protein [Xanthobacteraceae bacterium]